MDWGVNEKKIVIPREEKPSSVVGKREERRRRQSGAGIRTDARSGNFILAQPSNKVASAKAREGRKMGVGGLDRIIW